MYALTRTGDLESGAYAVHDPDGNIVVQFFVDRDDALCYNVYLEAIDTNLVVTEVQEENIDKLCEMMGYAHTIIEKGQVVVPRIETLQNELGIEP